MTPGPVDCCPRCLVAAIPHRAEHDPGGMRAYYSCTRCGKRWHTGWLLSAEEMALFGGGAA